MGIVGCGIDIESLEDQQWFEDRQELARLRAENERLLKDAVALGVAWDMGFRAAYDKWYGESGTDFWYDSYLDGNPFRATED